MKTTGKWWFHPDLLGMFILKLAGNLIQIWLEHNVQLGGFSPPTWLSTDDGQLSYLGILYKAGYELEDHPRTCKWFMWFITRVSKSPKDRVVGPLPNGLNGLQMGITNHLLSGMILQVRCRYDRWKVEYTSRTSRPNKEVLTFSLQFQGMSEWYVEKI